MPKLREQPPTREDLSAAYGFGVPEAFARLMRAVHRWALARAAQTKGNKRTSPYLALFDLTDVIDWVPAGPALGALTIGDSERCQRGYGTTPPEFMPFGDTCVDGAAYGYVIHAPELTASDYPAAHFCPMDSDGVYTAAESTMDSVRRMLAEQWRREQEDDGTPDPEAFRSFAAAAGVDWSPISKLRGLTRKHVQPPEVPRGWLWAKSADGVGVLAARDQFRDGGRGLKPHAEDDPYPEPKSELRAASQDLADGYAATALHRLRELWWSACGTGPEMVPAAAIMADAYDRLHRPLLARLVIERAEYVSDMDETIAERPKNIRLAQDDAEAAGKAGASVAGENERDGGAEDFSVRDA